MSLGALAFDPAWARYRYKIWLPVPAVREVTAPALDENLVSPWQQHVRDVVTDNNRVVENAQGLSVERFGRSTQVLHQRLRDDYQVLVGASNRLMRLLQPNCTFLVHG